MELISRWMSEYNQCRELPQMLGFSCIPLPLCIHTCTALPFAISVCTELFKTLNV
jgi:hypothetical protein